MTDSIKKEIQTLLKQHIERYPSQKKAVEALKSVSEATVINVRNGIWENISDDMWRNIGKQVGFSTKGLWQFVPTYDSLCLISFFEDAREFGNVFAITAKSGSGKSATAEYFASKSPNVYHIECAEYFNRKVFLQKLLEKMGHQNTGYNVAEMMDFIVERLMRQESPLVIMDEVDKLPDTVLYFFITFYNQLKNKCGIVLLSTDYLAKRIQRGVRLNRKGYNEIYSRIGRRFVSLRGTSKEEVEDICKENGCPDPLMITNIYKEYEGDLRRLERGVHKFKMKKQKNSAQKAA